MLYKNGYIFADGSFQFGSFRVEDGRFTQVLSHIPAEQGVDLNGAYVIPGLVDIHTHGNSGADFSQGDYQGLLKMARYLAQNGITAFAPTTVALPYNELEKAFATACRLQKEKPARCARVMGIHMEGPFLCQEKKGAQNSAYLKNPEFAPFKQLFDACDGMVRIADVAPELPGAMDFIRQASKLCTVSVSHTDASYHKAKAAFAAGATHLTHLYNAMPAIHHRNPGVIGAASETDGVQAELICDGIHVHPSAVVMAFRLFPGRVCLVSDALACCGMPNGQYLLGGQEIFLSNGVARLEDGTIAGAATNLYAGMRNAISFGISKEEAILSATRNPAKALGCGDEIGAIAPGLRADFLVCDEDLTLRQVWLGGERIC